MATTPRNGARRMVIAGLLTALVLGVTVSPASADTVQVGDLSLTAETANLDGIGATPVFQGDAAGNYIVSSPVTGRVTSWSFRSGLGAANGHRYVLRVLRPLDATASAWRAVATSAPGTVTGVTRTRSDLVQGPVSTDLPIQIGDRIALQPLDDGNTPIVVGVNGQDGIRYFSSPVPDGSSSTLAPAAMMDNGQVVPIQATVSFTPPPPSHRLAVTTSGTGFGAVTGTGINCGGAAAPSVCSTTVADGTPLTLTATPTAGSRFSGFTGGGCAATSPCTITVNADQSVDARFDTISSPGKQKPALLGFSLSAHRFRPAPVPPTVWPNGLQGKWGTEIRFSITQAATVDFTVDQCLPKPRRARASPCYRARPAGTFSADVGPGSNSLRFTGFMTQVGRSRARRQGFLGAALFPGHYRIEAHTLATGLLSPSDVKITYITIPDLAPTLSSLALSRDVVTEGSDGRNGSGITAFYDHTYSPPHPGDAALAVRKLLNIEILHCGSYTSTGCSSPAVDSRFTTVDKVSGANQLDLTSYINGSPGRTLLTSGRYRLVLRADGCAPVQADFKVSPKYVALQFPPPLAFKPYSFPAAPSGAVKAPPNFSSDFGTVVSFTEDRKQHTLWINLFHVFDSYGRFVAEIRVDAYPGRNQFYWSGISDLEAASGPLPPGPYTMVHEEWPGRIVAQVGFTIKPYHVGHT